MSMTFLWQWKMKVLVVRLCFTLCDPVDWIPPSSSVRGITQERILEWVVMTSSRTSSQPRDGTCILVSPALASGTCTWPLLPPGKPKHIFRDRQNQANPATPTDRHTQSTAEQPGIGDWELPTAKSGRFDAFCPTREHRAQSGHECDIKGSILKS